MDSVGTIGPKTRGRAIELASKLRKNLNIKELSLALIAEEAA